MNRLAGRRQGKLYVATLLTGAAMLLLAAAGRAAPPVLVPTFCPTGSLLGQCINPRGVAVDRGGGDIYVADQTNRRVQRFSAWGGSIGAWGSEGSGPGEFGIPQGLASDSAGDVYVVDRSNFRVQKFDAEGNFLLMFGGEVNETSGDNICPRPAFPADVCGKGVTGSANGFFGALAVGSYIAVGPGDKIYVGDQERVQVFNPSGEFLQSLPLPAGETAQALAVDTFPLSSSYEDIYVAYLKSQTEGDKEGVVHLSPAGAVLGVLPVPNPRAIATDASNGDVYVANKQVGKLSSSALEFLRFDAEGSLEESFGKGDLEETTGIATSSGPTCGLAGTDLIASNLSVANAFVRIYGPAPNPTLCPPPEAAPEIEDQYASAVDSAGATVRAQINPNFWTESTTYYVEYGTGECAAGGCPQSQPVPPGAPLEGPVTNEGLPASLRISGLAPDTTYHYRFVAESEGGGPVYGIDPDGEGPEEASFAKGLDATFRTFPAVAEPPPDSCANAAFRAGASARLPDCRAYEMVSPVEKNGTDVATGTVAQPQADEAGQRMTFTSQGAAGEPEGAYLTSQYLASRVDGSGWESHSVQAPRNTISLYTLGGINFQYKRFSPDLCDGWFVQDTTEALVPGAPSETPNLYRRDLCGGGYELMTTVAPSTFKLDPLASLYFPEPQGSSSDGTKTVFRANAALTANAAPEIEEEETYQLYLHQAGAPLRLISVLPSESASPGVASPLPSSAGTASGVLAQGFAYLDNVVGAVAENGERVFWSEAATPSLEHQGGPGTLYLRVNASADESAHDGSGQCTEAAKACTYQVSKLISEEPAQFWQGNGDGTRALFSIGETLYEFEASEEAGGLLTTSATSIAEGFKGFMGASADTTRAYFVSTKALAGGATAGKNNLYLYEKGVGFKLVEELSAADMIGAVAGTKLPPSPVSPLPFKRSSRVSPDGLHAAFLSTASLTGFDNTDQANGEADAEAFVYDATANAGAGEVVCASCNAGGARPSGRNINGSENPFFAAARIPGWVTEFQPSRALSEDGSRLFFESFEALVPRDTNGRADVYQWEKAASREECLNSLRGELFLTESSGCLSLISSGQSSEDSEFFDATPSGDDVFFATLSSLVGQDTGLLDVYDARVNGGFPPPPTPKASCEGEACQSPPPAPDNQTPASSTYNGPENLNEKKAKKCAKGKVKKKGKCVKKKHHKKKSKHKKHKKGKRAKTSGRAER